MALENQAEEVACANERQDLSEKEFSSAVDILCADLNGTKYAAFEQGFIRGHAVAKARNI